MQPLKVFKAAIKEGVFIIPFDFKSDHSIFKFSNVVYFV
jgi:hypothetical protein